MNPELRALTISATAWSTVDSLGRAVLQLGLAIALARLIAPEQFGIVAIVMLFSAVASVLADFGVATALIQEPEAGRRETSTAFLFNMGMSLVLAAALAAAAPAIARFYGEPQLIGLMWLMAANVVITALGSIQSTLLAKALDFKPLAIGALMSVAFSGLLGVFLAWRGFGVWALAWQVLAQTASNSLFLWLRSGWRPTLEFDRVTLCRLLGFGGRLMVSRVIDTTYSRLYVLVIGRVFGPNDLGQYVRAQSTQQIPADLMSRAVSRVALPAFSKASADVRALRDALRTSLLKVMFLNVPVMIGIALVASPLVDVLFGARWAPAAPLLGILALSGALWPLHVLNVTALLSQGHARLMLRIEIAKKLLGVSLLALACLQGLQAVAWSYLATSALSLFINTHYSGRLLGLGAYRQLHALRRIFAAAVAMAIVVVFVDAWLPSAPLLRLVALTLAGACVYFSTLSLMGEPTLKQTLAAVRARGKDTH